jgi:hypothetical protein
MKSEKEILDINSDGTREREIKMDGMEEGKAVASVADPVDPSSSIAAVTTDAAANPAVKPEDAAGTRYRSLGINC